jgi:Tfp pilus assembly protein PilV
MRPAKPKQHRARRPSGIYLVEVLVALVIGSLMMLALCALFLQTLRATSATSNQFVADQIGQSILEYVRSTGNFPTGPMEINSDGGVPLGIKQLVPLGIDQTNFQWSPKTISGEFRGNAVVNVTNAGAFSTITVTVTWADGVNLQSHTSSYSTVVYASGENI